MPGDFIAERPVNAAIHPAGLPIATRHVEVLRRPRESALYASVLIHSYALTENAAAERLGGDARDFGGIEDWGTRLLATTGSTWDSLNEGVAGAVEVAVVRNAYAHGGRRVDELAASRLQAVSMTSPTRGDLVALDYPTVRVFRGKLRLLMDLGESAENRADSDPACCSSRARLSGRVLLSGGAPADRQEGRSARLVRRYRCR